MAVVKTKGEEEIVGDDETRLSRQKTTVKVMKRRRRGYLDER